MPALPACSKYVIPFQHSYRLPYLCRSFCILHFAFLILPLPLDDGRQVLRLLYPGLHPRQRWGRHVAALGGGSA